MREAKAELWDYRDAGVLAITTSGSVDRRGACPLPRGCAAQARQRFPGLELRLGALLRERGNHVHDLGDGLVSFPVEHGWLERPDPALIERSARELRELADARGWALVVVPRPGCGGGGLSWREVRPLLERHFDERFLVVSRDD